jgi:hypothetical protein
MFCEEYKQLQSELSAARGDWIYFAASKRAAGITEHQAKEMVRRAKNNVQTIKNQMLDHMKTCLVCRRTNNDAMRGAS